ncbi:unnamed protein product [Moneuplotes crassus]|uniref:Protein kinase domain-containing protein n=1 Tax=Euplotes crassus TaxID=5936 RepID=A0AAD2CY39_EUPCR|nr:unnamed protein product [Moneuplotes crassus]
MITCGPYIIKETLGKGGYATVKKAQHSETGKECALKIMKRSGVSEAFKKQVKSEISVMRELSHQNIINMIDYSEEAHYVLPDGRTTEVYYIALELAEHGEIFDFIVETGRLPESMALYYFHQLVEALDHLHQKGISHRDIKPENILLNKNFDLKLTDFGFAEWMEVSDVRKGTDGYMAPEMHNSKNFKTQPLDIFALGIVLFILIKGSPPFCQAKSTDQHYRLFCSKPELFWKVHFKRFPDYDPSSDLMELLSNMLNPDEERRITIEEIKQSAWYNQLLPSREDAIVEMTSKILEMQGGQMMED